MALTEKKEEQLNESTTFSSRPSRILFYTFSEPSSPQVWKVNERDHLSECGELKSWLKRDEKKTAFKKIVFALT